MSSNASLLAQPQAARCDEPSRKAKPVVPLSRQNPVVSYECGDFLVTYVLDRKSGMVGLRLLPGSKQSEVVPHREYLVTPEILAQPGDEPFAAYHGEVSLVQLKLAEDDSGRGFSGGRSMRVNPTVEGLVFTDQSVDFSEGGFEVLTMLQGARDFRCRHRLSYRQGDDAVTVETCFENTGEDALTLEMLSSFTVGYLSPFDDEDSSERLQIHRFRSFWSAEGRHEKRSLEDLHMERSWSSYSVVNERFGQVGSMPVRGFAPFVAVEDEKAGVFWGAQLACPASWQIEVFRRDDKVSLSGGLADREFGHWTKRIKPGETFVAPRAFLSTGTGSFDSFCQRLTRMQVHALEGHPRAERGLPVIFNEWCSSWGWPTPEFISRTAERLRELPVEIFVIDDGWAEKPAGTGQYNGDWNVERARFPGGLKPVADRLREQGFTPGLWFEFEVCTEGTEAFSLTDHKLRRDGRVLKVGSRHFWDFRDPWTFEYLTQKVIHRLRDDGFGYLKVDYNETIGLGCDDPDSLGEGLRKHIEGVQAFFQKIREALPDLIIETCSSGGHRLEPSMMALAAMGSFSDAHESADIPIIAANLHRLILPRQSQIWAVLHAEDSLVRLHYSLAACFLGRACLSGEVTTLSPEQFALVREMLGFYLEVKPIIRDGESEILREMSPSYRHPQGWQAVVRTSRPAGDECLVVIHVFENELPREFEVALSNAGRWQVLRESLSELDVELIAGSVLRCRTSASFGSGLVRLRLDQN